MGKGLIVTPKFRGLKTAFVSNTLIWLTWRILLKHLWINQIWYYSAFFVLLCDISKIPNYAWVPNKPATCDYEIVNFCDVILVFLLLTLNIYHSSSWCFDYYFERVNINWAIILIFRELNLPDDY